MDNEIQADAEQDWIEQQRQEALEYQGEEDAGHEDGRIAAEEDAREAYKAAMEDNDPPKPIEYTDEELEEMNQTWQRAMREGW